MDVFRDLGIPEAAVLAYLATCAVLGLAALRKLSLASDETDPASNPWLCGFFALSLGLVFSVTTLLILGLLGLLQPYAVAFAHLMLLLWAGTMLAKFPQPSPHAILRGLIRPETLLVVALYIWIALAAIRVPGHFDDTMYHLPLARYYVEHHALAVQPFLRYPFFPQNMELLFALGLMFGNDVAAQTLATVPLFVIAIGLIGAGAWLFGSILPGFAAVVLMLSLATLRKTLGYSYVDNGLALFCWGAYLALALWEGTDRKRRHWLVAAGVLAGAAMGSKFFGTVPAVMIGAWILLGRRDWKAALVYGGTALLFGMGWYLRSWILSGDPLHPVGGPLFGYYLWNARDLMEQKSEQSLYGVTKQIAYLWPALKEARFTEWALALSWIVFAWKSPKQMRLLFGLFLAYLLFWFYATQLPRYLAPIYALGCLFSIAAIVEILRLLAWPIRRLGWRWRDGWIVPVACLALAIHQLIPAREAALARIAHWQQALDGRSGSALFLRANQLKPQFGDRLSQVGFEKSVYLFEGTVIGDWFGPGRYWDVIECKKQCQLRPPEVVKARMHEFDSRMLMVRTAKFQINLESYRRDFDIQLQTPQGVLMTLK